MRRQTQLQNSIIEMFKEGQPSTKIAKVLKCHISHVSTTITNYLYQQNGISKKFFAKPSVEPIVLITANEEVREAYKKLTAYDKF